MSFTRARAVGAIHPYLLTQADVTVEAKPLDEQPQLAAIAAQAQQVAEAFRQFVAAAKTTLDIAIYDFRLEVEGVRTTIVDAINGAADRGVTVRIAYDKAQEAEDGPILKLFRNAGADPAPVGTDHFLRARAKLSHAVQVKAIAEEAIAPGSQIMHQKYMIRDGASAHAAVWTGSTNFTVDAWGLQDNNIVVVTDCQALAAAFTKDFTDMWTSAKLSGSGAGDQGTATVAGQAIGYAFAPGEGKAIETTISDTIDGATTRLRIASMVTSSQNILTALRGRIDAGVNVAGVYDFGETDQVRSTWSRLGETDKVALLDAVTAKLVAKHSLLYAPQLAHNFMHDKIVVADDTVVTGSFNFSLNATRNAENILVIENAALAKRYAEYIDELAHRYRAATP